MAEKDNASTDKEKEQKLRELSPEMLLLKLKSNVAKKLAAGETGLTNDIKQIRDLEETLKKASGGDAPETEEFGIPERFKVKRRSYTLSKAAVEQRRKAQKKATEAMQKQGASTGPKTDAGKKASRHNAWKHGSYADSLFSRLTRPCKKTCPDYPCVLIEGGNTAPGQPCMDAEYLYEAFMAILDAVKNNNYDDFNSMAALTTSANIQILRKMQEALIEDGVVVMGDKFDKDGTVIGRELKVHPAIPYLAKLTEALGFTPKDLNITPRELAKEKQGDKFHKTLAEMMSGVPRKEDKE
ncbi:MAG: hypothetical protein Q7U10_08725 [Thermodesulfovibrionia bacterium]|nr:hypothetical protein [Thermodesulfovibrionia bacterium]